MTLRRVRYRRAFASGFRRLVGDDILSLRLRELPGYQTPSDSTVGLRARFFFPSESAFRRYLPIARTSTLLGAFSQEQTTVSPRQVWRVSLEAIDDWLEDRAPSMGAALAFYSSFSIVPLLVVTIAISGLVFGREAATGQIVAQLRDLLGDTGADVVKDMLKSATDFGTGIIATAIGIVALLIAATTAFVELQDDLDRIWKAKPRVSNGILNLILSRLLSFGMVLSVGFLLTVSLVLSAAVAAAGKHFLSEGEEVLTHALSFLVFLVITTALFAMIYKVLPNAPVAWKDVWAGAALTALLFSVGKFLIGLYIGKSEVASPFGAAAPVVVLMLWTYYSAQIFLLGAEFTHVFALMHGSRRDDAVRSAGAERETRPLRPQA